MSDALPKRLIEVDLPIKRISAHARREKSIRHGHISTLHIWWARRPLAACRAVTCAALWPDPADENCPAEFRAIAADLMFKWGRDNAARGSAESAPTWTTIRQHTSAYALCNHPTTLRQALLDFIADFSNWDNSTVPEYLETARALTAASHWSLSLSPPKEDRALGWPGSEQWNERVRVFMLQASAYPRPLVVDPFAGGGSIPLEALRVGADAFASDLNPLPLLLNKVTLEYIPKYGSQLADGIRKWGDWVKQKAKDRLKQYYPLDDDGATPIAYLWARTIKCEGPNCGANIPLLGRSIIAQRKKHPIAIKLSSSPRSNRIVATLVEGAETKTTANTCKGFVATCPRVECQYSTPKKSVQRQLFNQGGGADTSMLMAVLTDGPSGRKYRLPNKNDAIAIEKAGIALREKLNRAKVDGLSRIPNEPIPSKTAHRAVGSQWPLYGFKTWGDLFSARQKYALVTLQDIAKEAYGELLKECDSGLATAIYTLLAFAIDKQADYSSTLCRWVTGGEFIAGTLAGEKKYPMISDFAESNPIGGGSGSWDNHIDWIGRYIEKEAGLHLAPGTVCYASANEHPLPSNSAAAMLTDPPYYDSVPYSDLSDFFYVWLRRTLAGVEQFNAGDLTPKDREMTVNHPDNVAEKKRYTDLLAGAFTCGCDYTDASGIAVIVFAHKSTSGWETLLDAIIKGGWVVTASWPVDTERSARPNALNTASLVSSVHIVCRPRRNVGGQNGHDTTGDWRDILRELPIKIHEWMPRLALEGVVGADAIFACLGPALEIFSRYSRVEKASGDEVTLREYLEHIWAAVSKEALSSLITGTDLSMLESDARITAMWLWTINGGNTVVEDVDDGDGADATENEEGEDRTSAKSGFGLEYDAARKIAQGLGASLEDMKAVVEVKGDQARLLPVAERTAYLFGKDQASTPDQAARGKKKKAAQMDLFAELTGAETTEAEAMWDEKTVSKPGATVLDRVHQSMILFATGRGEALKRFLVEDGIGREGNFWKLAQALSALYPSGSQEKRWVDGVLARKKGLGL